MDPRGARMTDNRNVDAAWAYHDGTKHLYQSVRSRTHSLDFSNQPLPFKIYTTLPPMALPQDFAPLRMPVLAAIAEPPSRPSARRGEHIPDLKSIAQILHLGAGISRHRKADGWEFPFRTAACTGALYPIELYLVCGDLPGLQAGVYHFGVHDFALRRLRAGDYRALLVRAAAGEPSVAEAPAVIICTSTFWRNAWKYQARAYRAARLEGGIIGGKLYLAGYAQGLGATGLTFYDDDVTAFFSPHAANKGVMFLTAVGHPARRRAG